MPVDTKKVTGRRAVSYGTLDEFMSDAESISAAESKTVGNWSIGQILWHLAASMDASIDGTKMKAPWLMMVILNLFMKNSMLTKPMRPGYKIPASGQDQFAPPESTTPEDGLAKLRTAIERQKSDLSRGPHMAFGEITREEWDKFHLRHAEMHMSFIVPQ